MEFFRGKSISAVRVGRLRVYAIHAEGERFRVLVQWGQRMEEPFVPSVGLRPGWSEVVCEEV